MIIFGLLFLILGLPLILLSRRFYQLSDLEGLAGRARTARLGWLVLLASGIAFGFYCFVVLYSTPIPTFKTSGRSAWRLGYEHSTMVMLLAGAVVTFLLVRRPAQRMAGICFAAGVFLVMCGLGVQWYRTEYPAYKLQQMRVAAESYRNTGWQRAAADSFRVQSQGYPIVDNYSVTRPQFPGGEAMLEHEMRAELLRRSAPRPPVKSYVRVRFIVDTTGKILLPHVVEGLGPGYDEEAVRVIRRLPPFSSPALNRKRKPVAAVMDITVAFPH